MDENKKSTIDSGYLLTPEEVAEHLKVTAEQIRSLIRKGRIEASNVSAGTKRPLYRIKQGALDDFLNRRALGSSLIRIKKAKRLPPVPDFFPDLK